MTALSSAHIFSQTAASRPASVRLPQYARALNLGALVGTVVAVTVVLVTALVQTVLAPTLNNAVAVLTRPTTPFGF